MLVFLHSSLNIKQALASRTKTILTGHCLLKILRNLYEWNQRLQNQILKKLYLFDLKNTFVKEHWFFMHKKMKWIELTLDLGDTFTLKCF